MYTSPSSAKIKDAFFIPILAKANVKSELMRKSWLITCLINFCIAILMAIGLRSAYVFPTTFDYKFLLHAHSHTVLLGWCYPAIYAFIVAKFLSKEAQKSSKYNRLFWITEISVIGMAVTFPFQGYALFSIIFSTLHILCSYYFVCQIFKDHQSVSIFETKLLKSALIFMIFSTIGVWFLGPIASSGAKDSPFYDTAIQFFLHFQFNGWFIMAVLALFFNQMRVLNISHSHKLFNRLYYASLIGIVLTFALPLSWFFNGSFFRMINSIGILFQLFGFYYLVLLIKPHAKKILHAEKPITKLLLVIAFISVVLKIAMQTSTVIPELAIASHGIRNFTVGFIHLVMIGIINSFLFASITKTHFYSHSNKLASTGVLLFLSGFLFMEYLLFNGGLRVFIGKSYQASFFTSIFYATIAIAIGLFLFTFAFICQKRLR